MYSTNFLNWIGLNRVDYQTQYYDNTNEYTWNYNQSTNKLDGRTIIQGNWRGVYMWLYDTATPNMTPWEMLGLYIKPSWWDTRYGEMPYTNGNTTLWNDLENGYVYNSSDYGNTWTKNKSLKQSWWVCASMSGSGKIQAVCAINCNLDLIQIGRAHV